MKKNILAENLVRFGAKNLTESNIEKLSEVAVINEAYTDGTVTVVDDRGKQKEKVGQVRLLQKAQIPYPGPFAQGDSSDAYQSYTAKVKSVNVNYQLTINLLKLSDYGNPFINGGQLILDTLEMQKSENTYGTTLGGDVKVNQTLTFKGGPNRVAQAKFSIPIPAPKSRQFMDNGKPAISFAEKDNRNNPIGLSANYKLTGRIQATPVDRATYVAGIEKSIASGRLKDTDGGKARIAKWDATNPSGVAKSFRSFPFYAYFDVDIKKVAVPILPSQARG